MESGSLFGDKKTHDIEIWADTVKIAVCRGRTCHSTITWGTNRATGRMMCFTGKIDRLGALSTKRDDGGREYWVLPLERNHWKSCPDAATFKKRGAKK